jgi:hypothetical protein
MKRKSGGKKDIMSDNNITPIPGPVNIMIGYCPNCGLSPVYEADRIRIESLSPNNIDIYRCIHCKQEFNGSEAIPF